MQQKLTFTNRVHLPFDAHPLKHGVPWPIGAVRPSTTISARDESGAPIPVGTRTLNLWPDGSVQWSLIDLALDMPPSGTRVVTIITDESSAPGAGKSPEPKHPVTASQTTDGWQVSNGLVTLSASNKPGDTLVTDWDSGTIDALIVDTQGQAFSAAHCKSKHVYIEELNALRAVLRVEGKHTSTDGKTLLEFWVRFTVTANRPDVRVTYHYHNLEAAEPGVMLKTMELRLNSTMPADSTRAIVHGFRGRETRIEPYRLSEDFEICASNTMDLETYPQTHVGITGGGNGKVFIRQPELLRDDPMQKPWFLRNVVDFKFQTKDAPEASVWSHVGLMGSEKSLVIAAPNMIGLHPKSLQVEGARVSYWVWPAWAGDMLITQGEGRTLEFMAAPLSPQASDSDIMRQYLSWEFSGVFGHWPAQPSVTSSMDIDHVRACRVFYVDLMPAFKPNENFALERKIQSQWTPDGPAPALGHWHYGDAFARWDIGVNNEEMVGHTWYMEYLRTGRPQCLEKALAQTQHIADVDICRKSSDPFQEGGMCAHGPRHNHCSAYPSHMWYTEMLFGYALTGDEEFKKAAVIVSDNLVKWVTDPWGFKNLCADGRESGQPLINLTWVYRFVPDPKYLAAIEKIIRVSFIQRVEKHGSLVYMKPREDLPLLKFQSYGEWAAWEGLFYAWDLTRDETTRAFILSQLNWRLKEDLMNTSGSFRNTDFNVAAYAYLMTQDPAWLMRVKRPFKTVFRSVQWPFGYIKAMYFLKLALEHGIVNDDDVLIS